MKFRRPKTTKVCPRCGNKCLLAQEKCDDCGLLFSRLQYASNKAAKRKIAHFDSDFVIYTKDYPSDLKWWKVLLMTIFTGLFGGHYYYLIFCTIFNAQMVSALQTYGAYLPISILGFSWIYSLSAVCIKKFKVPVIVEMPEAEVVNAEVKK